MFKLQRQRVGTEPGVRTTSIYRSAAGRAAIMAWYDRKLAALPVHTETHRISTSVGPTHLVLAGPPDAPPVVVLPGMQMNAATMATALVTLSQTHRVYAIDVVGMPGKSAEVRLVRTGDSYPRWLIEVLDALALPRAHFLGLSFGGWLLLKLAALAPGRISGAVLLESGGLTPFTFAGQVVGGVGALLYMLHPSERTLHYAAVTPFYARGRSPDPDLVTFFGLTYRHVTLDLDLSGLPVVSREAIAGLTAPVLVLYGERSRFFNATKSIARAREIVPNLAAEVIASEGHLFSADAERRVYGRIAEFLG